MTSNCYNAVENRRVIRAGLLCQNDWRYLPMPGSRLVTGMQWRRIRHGGCQRELHLHASCCPGWKQHHPRLSKLSSTYTVILFVPRCSQVLHTLVLEVQHILSAVVRISSPVRSWLTLIRHQYTDRQTLH